MQEKLIFMNITLQAIFYLFVGDDGCGFDSTMRDELNQGLTNYLQELRTIIIIY